MTGPDPGTGSAARRYVVVGLANTGLDLALFTALAVGADLPALLANVVSTAVVMTVSFFLNRGWVFRSDDAGAGSYVGFVAVTLTSALVVQSLVILGATPVLEALREAVVSDLSTDLVPPAAKVAAMAVGMVTNFLGYRWVFSRARTEAA